MLANVLQCNMTLEELGLECTCIDAEGASQLAVALKGSTGLKKLNLGGNILMGDKGQRKLAHALRSNTELKELDMSGTGANASLFEDALRGNTTLEVLVLSGPIPRLLQRTLERNRGLRERAIEPRKLMFVWCVQMTTAFPVEIVELIVRRVVWGHEVSLGELQKEERGRTKQCVVM
eukprot:TRINITY_DN5226_c0_g1_i10.p1 TRINITY_DN5226_c0_g1~~TRINITY_DN5226_c0_g1_i10.p1  ORF type:complete len:177 (-),score=31.81 TRINITY_DN5226_c0_g1_i10:135-665(-)